MTKREKKGERENHMITTSPGHINGRLRTIPLPLILLSIYLSALGAVSPLPAAMQNQIGLRPSPLATDAAIAGKLHHLPENPVTKFQVHSILTENTALLNSPGKVRRLVSENSVLVLGRRACCMCHVMKRLLQSLGVNPAVYDVAKEEEPQVVEELRSIFGDLKDGFPLVFIGGRSLGGLDDLMAAHITGELIPILKQAGALWL